MVIYSPVNGTQWRADSSAVRISGEQRSGYQRTTKHRPPPRHNNRMSHLPRHNYQRATDNKGLINPSKTSADEHL